MKVYVLTHDWAIDGDSYCESVGVYATKENAIAAMTKRIGELGETHSIGHMKVEEEGEDYYEIYEEGYYSQDHERLTITTHEIE